MQKLKLTVELEYDEELMHANEPEAIKWFYEDILQNKRGEERLLLHSNEIGDVVGDITVLEIHQ